MVFSIRGHDTDYLSTCKGGLAVRVFVRGMTIAYSGNVSKPILKTISFKEVGTWVLGANFPVINQKAMGCLLV